MVERSGRKNAPDLRLPDTASHYPGPFWVFRSSSSDRHLTPTRISVSPGTTWGTTCFRDKRDRIRLIHFHRSQDRILEIRPGIRGDSSDFFVLLSKLNLQPGRSLIRQLLVCIRSQCTSSSRLTSHIHVLENREIPNSKTECPGDSFDGSRADYWSVTGVKF